MRMRRAIGEREEIAGELVRREREGERRRKMTI